MQYYERDFFISQILSEEIIIDDITFRQLDSHTKYLADKKYKDALDNSIELFDEREIIGVLFQYGAWTDDMEFDYQELPKAIENLKVEYYQSFWKSNNYRQQIEQKEKRLMELLDVRHSWDLYTRQGYANFVRRQFILESIARPNNHPSLFSYYSRLIISDKILRELARTDPWLTIFDMGVKLNYNDENHRRLFNYTKMYKSVRDHSECPPDEIVNDDYALDGWLILQKRQRDKDKNVKEVEKKLGKNKNAQEVCIVASNQEEAKRIYELNDARAQTIINSRLEAAQKGIKDIQNMPDIRNKIC